MNQWQECDGAFRISWSDREWELRLDDDSPGLRSVEPGCGPLLSLEGLAEAGRTASRACSRATLVEVERTHTRITATYRPLGWGATQVRASWWPSSAESVDLLVEIQARSVGRLAALEVKLRSCVHGEAQDRQRRVVLPRDARSAALSYDGRELALDQLTTDPPGEALTPWLAPQSPFKGVTYVELAAPNDVCRRIQEGRSPYTLTRYGLFGHDLEKGVVLRARLRGLWLPKAEALTECERRWHEFLEEPLPLTR